MSCSTPEPDLDSGMLVTRCAGFPAPDVTSVAFHPSDSHRLFASCGMEVVEFDIRSMAPSFNGSAVNRLTLSDEEINRIDIHSTGHLLAAADDAGDVRLMDLTQNTVSQRLTGIHKNICSSAIFSPYAPNELISGGLDTQLVGWNYETSDILWRLDMRGESGAQVFNPPMVHDVAVPDTQSNEHMWPGLVAVCRGDGVVWVGSPSGFPPYLASESESDYDSQTSSPTNEFGERVSSPSDHYVLLDYSRGGHTSSVSCARFLPQSDGERLISCGDDCMIIGWDWPDEYEGGEPPKQWSLNHRYKLNSLDIRSTDSNSMELFVAGVKPELSIYKTA